MIPEVNEYLNWIESKRNKVWEVLQSVPTEAWNWTPTKDETNSLYVIATHAYGSEHGWIFEILGGGEKTRKRSTEFLASGTSPDALRAKYDELGQETRPVLEALTEADLTTTRFRESHGEVSVRWILLHVIEHYSEHVGQMYLTKQLWQDKRN